VIIGYLYGMSSSEKNYWLVDSESTEECASCNVRILEQHILNWLKESTFTAKPPVDAKRLIDLISIIDDPEAYPPPSKQYSFYSEEVGRLISELGSETKARQFVSDVYLLSQTVSVPSVVVYFPPLREYVNRFRRTPELLVTLYSYCSAVPPEEQGAGEWLRQADEIAPDNEYVLWQRLLSRGEPWFPEELKHGNDLFLEEKWLLDKLLKRNPNDPLAIGVQCYLDKSKGSFKRTENAEFLNSLRRLAPDPMKQIGLLRMLNPQSNPRTGATPVVVGK
jgi:hypothetical protein